MDAHVANEFPFVLTKKSGLAKSIVSRMADDLLHGKGFSATSKFLKQAYMNTYMKLLRGYVSLVNRRNANVQGMMGGQEGEREMPVFGDFGDRHGFNGTYPSDNYLRSIWHKWFYEIPIMQVGGDTNHDAVVSCVRVYFESTCCPFSRGSLAKIRAC